MAQHNNIDSLQEAAATQKPKWKFIFEVVHTEAHCRKTNLRFGKREEKHYPDGSIVVRQELVYDPPAKRKK